MLVLSRKRGQKIRIGEAIEVSVRAIDGDRVRLGIEAPREMPILRGELARFLRREPPHAREGGPDDAD
jgi:carbon storage regulator